MLSLNGQVRTVQLEQVRHELALLLSDIGSASARLSCPPSPPAQTSPGPSRFARLAARLTRKPSRKRYLPLDERGLLRRGSDESDASCLSAKPAGPDRADTPAAELGDASTTELLAQLAPLVSGLQALTPKVVGLAEPALAGPHESACAALLDLLDRLRPADGEAFALEMRELMLEALVRKVRAEQRAVAAMPSPSSSASNSPALASTTNSPSDSPQTELSVSPFAQHQHNPFILHSTSLLHSSRRASLARSIPAARSIDHVGAAGAYAKATAAADAARLGAPPSYHSFVGQSQLTAAWQTGIVRLGSFQASALFSPSPIAVRRVVGHGKA
ncbi:hypothetical protein Q5752_003444 [Cryptotrichosporon argae]